MRIRKILFDKCLSQKVLAKKVGISKSYVSAIVLGTRKPGPEVRRKIGRALGIAPAEIFSE